MAFTQQEQATNDLISDFETRDDDVFVCAYMKSGTTWVQHIINLVRYYYLCANMRTPCLLDAYQASNCEMPWPNSGRDSVIPCHRTTAVCGSI